MTAEGAPVTPPFFVQALLQVATGFVVPSALGPVEDASGICHLGTMALKNRDGSKIEALWNQRF